MPRAARPQPTPPLPLAAPGNFYLGTSGWAYPTWKPGFYPAGVSARKFLTYYASQLNSVEVNYTFRTLPSATQLQGWLDATPSGFRFSFKAPQRITHFQRLRDCSDTVTAFLASLAPARHDGKLGPLLFQLPPNFKADLPRLASFLKLRSLATKHRERLAFEFRHASWFCDETYALLGKHNVALCVAESDDLATPDVTTADFRCYRLRCTGGYSTAERKAFAKRFLAHAKSGPLFAYLKHEEEPTGALHATDILRQAVSLANKRAR